VWSVVVSVDVAADRGTCIVEGLELAAPSESLFQIPEPAFDERL